MSCHQRPGDLKCPASCKTSPINVLFRTSSACGSFFLHFYHSWFLGGPLQRKCSFPPKFSRSLLDGDPEHSQTGECHTAKDVQTSLAIKHGTLTAGSQIVKTHEQSQIIHQHNNTPFMWLLPHPGPPSLRILTLRSLTTARDWGGQVSNKYYYPCFTDQETEA